MYVCTYIPSFQIEWYMCRQCLVIRFFAVEFKFITVWWFFVCLNVLWLCDHPRCLEFPSKDFLFVHTSLRFPRKEDCRFFFGFCKKIQSRITALNELIFQIWTLCETSYVENSVERNCGSTYICSSLLKQYVDNNTLLTQKWLLRGIILLKSYQPFHRGGIQSHDP
jgi:hypothetical protein